MAEMESASEKNIPIQSGKDCCGRRGFKRGMFCHHRSCPRSNDFRVCLDLKQFKLDDITVRTKERHIIVDAKKEHEEFSQKYELPDEYDVNTISSFFSGKGKLFIKATKSKISETGERFIDIQHLESEESQEKDDE
jgi:hypothetical protein